MRIERAADIRLAAALVVLLGLAGFGPVAAIGRGEGGRVVPLAVAGPAIGARPVEAVSPSAGLPVRPGRVRAEPTKATAERLVAAVDQALREIVPGAAWTGPPEFRRPAYLYEEGRDGRLISATVGSRLVHQGRGGMLRVTISLGPAGSAAPGQPSFDWSCGSADRRRGAMCEASREPDGVRTKIETSVDTAGMVRHRVDVELPEGGRLQLDVSNTSGKAAAPPVSDAPLLMEEARAVALNIAAGIGS